MPLNLQPLSQPEWLHYLSSTSHVESSKNRKECTITLRSAIVSAGDPANAALTIKQRMEE